MQIRLTSAQEDRLEAVLLAAQRTEFYRDRLRGLQSPVQGLDTLPFITPEDFDENRRLYRDPRAARQKPQFRYPLEKRPRVLVLVDGFQRSNYTRSVFDDKCDTVAAPVQALREMAKIAGPQSFPVVAFTGTKYGTLSQADRELFWKTFHVAVFEQLLGPQNELVAEECDAHDGLHVDEDQMLIELRSSELAITPLMKLECPVLRLTTGLTAKLDRSLCPCGRPGLRLLEVAPLKRALYASAG